MNVVSRKEVKVEVGSSKSKHCALSGTRDTHTHDEPVARSFAGGQTSPVRPHLLGRFGKSLVEVGHDGFEGVVLGVVEHEVGLDFESVWWQMT